MRLVLTLLFAGFLLHAMPAAAQVEVVPAPDARPSPVALAKVMLGDTYVKLHYSSPRKRDREIFGGLVPFDTVWRTGANEATEITLTGPVMFGATRVEAGNYAVFTIPGEDGWTFILNNGLGQWGAFAYDESQDAHRISADSGMSDKQYEAFTIAFEETEAGATMHLLWDRTRASVELSLP